MSFSWLCYFIVVHWPSALANLSSIMGMTWTKGQPWGPCTKLDRASCPFGCWAVLACFISSHRLALYTCANRTACVPLPISFPCRWGCARPAFGGSCLTTQSGHCGEHHVLQKRVAKEVFLYGYTDLAFYHGGGLNPESAHNASHSWS